MCNVVAAEIQLLLIQVSLIINSMPSFSCFATYLFVFAVHCGHEAESFQVTSDASVRNSRKTNRNFISNKSNGHESDHDIFSKTHILLQFTKNQGSRLYLEGPGSSTNEQSQDDELNKDLNTFRSLMGTLYGFAGIAHAVDCLFGSSQLLVAAGNLPFNELPMVGQILALIWCLAGPLAFILSRKGGTVADAGLATYGIVEMGCAAFSPDVGTVINAGLVQVIVFASWMFSRQKGISSVNSE